jgi:lipid A disaccharide synthetase
VRPVYRPPATVPRADPEAVYPEYLTVQDPAPEVAAHVTEWLVDPAARAHVLDRLEAVAATVVQPGSAARAAAAVLEIARPAAPRALRPRRRAA